MIKNCHLTILGKLKNPTGFEYIFAWNTKTKEYVVKRERVFAPTENLRAGGGCENRRVLPDFDEVTSFYQWGLRKGWKVLIALPSSHTAP